MSIWSRLGSVINSYLNEFESETSGQFKSSGDPDLDAAYDELNDYLKRENTNTGTSRQTGYTWKDTSDNRQGNTRQTTGKKLPPRELRPDFEYLGVPFGADNETCKAAYKKLLKIHHPDRHAGHEGNFKKATERSARINAAWDRIEKWRETEGK